MGLIERESDKLLSFEFKDCLHEKFFENYKPTTNLMSRKVVIIGQQSMNLLFSMRLPTV